MFPAIDASTMRFILIALFISLLALGVWRWVKSGKPVGFSSSTGQLLLICALYIVADLVFLWVAMLFANPPPDVDNRMLSPLLPILFIFLLGLIVFSGEPFNRRWPFAIVMIAVTFLFCITFAKQEKKYVVNMHFKGAGFTSTRS